MYLVRAERWQYLLEPIGPTRFWVAFRTTVIGFAATFVLPARAGEVLRPYLLARHEGLPATAAFATIIVERMLDLVGGADSARRVLPGVRRATRPRRRRGSISAVALGGAIMAPVGARHSRRDVRHGRPSRAAARLVLRLERVLPERMARAVAGFARTFAEGLAVVRRPSRLVLALAWSLVLWLVIAAQVWVVARAFGIVLPFGGSFLLTAMLVVGVAVPTPGGVGGTHEAFRLGVTSFYGADNNAAVGAAIVQHAVNFVPISCSDCGSSRGTA